MSLQPSLRASLLFGALFCALSAVLLLKSVDEVRTRREFLHRVRSLEQALDFLALETFRGAALADRSGFGLMEIRERPVDVHQLAVEVDSFELAPATSAPFAPALLALESELGAYQARLALATEPLLIPKSISEGLLRLRRSAQDLLAAADDDVDQTEDRLFVLVALLPACMVALLGILSMRLRRRILKPARVLEQALDELRRGGWPEELSSSGLQELGGVTQKFNAMAQDKRHVEEALREVQAELQSRVALRTHELELLNASMEGEIQERRGTEERLRSSEERFRRMFEVGPIGIAIISARGVVMEANSSLRKIAGGDHDPVGRKLSDYCEPARAEELRQGLRAALQAGEESFSGEVVVRQSGGETRLVNFVASAVRAPAGELDYGLLMVRDIPERRRAEELLLESERFAAMGRMAARIAHEINNPLAGIKNAFRLIKPAVSPEHPYAHYVPRIDHEIDRVAGIVREMYELYRPSGEVQQECWIDEAITDVVALLRVAQPEGRIELDVCAARVRACLASGPLRQVLYNLIQNGLEHSPEGSPVRVSAVVEGDVLKLTVEDHGEGISPEDGARIFDSFFSTKEGRVNAGLGLGLAITHSAVEAMGGTVEFESELHVGTSFRVSIPLQVEGAENLPSPSELAALPS